jgi:hypothetical protein
VAGMADGVVAGMAAVGAVNLILSLG